jgi:hypothetical protein
MTKVKQYEDMYALYQQGHSLEAVGRAFGLTRQSVYIGFKRRGWRLRTPPVLPFQKIDGYKFSLRNTGYYGRTYGDRMLAHRYVWEKHNGKIPDNHDIHHKNHDKSDNRIENLELLRKDEHARKYSTGCNQSGHTDKCTIKTKPSGEN